MEASGANSPPQLSSRILSPSEALRDKQTRHIAIHCSEGALLASREAAMAQAISFHTRTAHLHPYRFPEGIHQLLPFSSQSVHQATAGC